MLEHRLFLAGYTLFAFGGDPVVGMRGEGNSLGLEYIFLLFEYF